MGGKSSIGIQSIEVGVPVLAAFRQSPDAMSLTAIAKAANMTSSKAHKYLASFVRAGLVSQDSRSGFYRLGPLALELGLTAIRTLSAVDISEGAMLELRDRIDLSLSMTVWSNQGPTIIRRLETRHTQFVVMRLGTVMPLLTSANGRVFLAYLDRRFTQDLIEAELGDAGGPAAKAGLHTLKDVDELAAQVRADRVSKIDGIISGLVGMSAPIFDISNTITAAITVAGVRGTDLAAAKPHLLATADALSRQLGATCIPSAAPPTPRAARRALVSARADD